ncbi:hypothetical protein NLG97_g824 [Lecanicillium saksenae]|uniref:Uncharacterized protein n=1 Tax=Lecanicillium saksenae TaxID=468837 RepID=A0ACC1R781_9HYPO|nr:hypothetical protein NLG97_g824 [Lecanicillium saksenae]
MSDEWTAEFLFPATTGYVMHNLDVMEVSYKSNYPNASLWAFCYNGKVDNANLVIMGVYKNAHPFDGSELFQFTNDFSSDFCWYNLRNLDNDEKGLNGIRFSYDWKTRDSPSTLRTGSKPEITDPRGSTVDAPASASATITSAAASTGKARDSTPDPSAGTSSAPTASGPDFGVTTQSVGIESPAPSQGRDASTTKPPREGNGGSLLNATVPLMGNGTVGNGTGKEKVPAPPLGGGVIAGIVVGAVLGVLGIFGLLGALWVVKRQRKSTLARGSRIQERESKGTFGRFGRAEADSRALPQELYVSPLQSVFGMATAADYERLGVWAAMLNTDFNVDRRGSKRVVDMEVLSIGLQRTGTVSMREANSILGYEKPYYCASIFENCREADMWNEALCAKFSHPGKQYSRAEFDRLLGHSAAITAVPGCILWAELIEAYPEAKAVLVQRDEDKWVLSVGGLIDGVLNAVGQCVLRLTDPFWFGRIPKCGRFWTGEYFGSFIPAVAKRNAREVYRKH